MNLESNKRKLVELAREYAFIRKNSNYTHGTDHSNETPRQQEISWEVAQMLKKPGLWSVAVKMYFNKGSGYATTYKIQIDTTVNDIEDLVAEGMMGVKENFYRYGLKKKIVAGITTYAEKKAVAAVQNYMMQWGIDGMKRYALKSTYGGLSTYDQRRSKKTAKQLIKVRYHGRKDPISGEEKNPEEVLAALLPFDLDEQAQETINLTSQKELWEIVTELFKHLSDREVQILFRRNGIGGKKEKLEEIGLDYGITRERVRQIQAAAMKKIRNEVARLNLEY